MFLPAIEELYRFPTPNLEKQGLFSKYPSLRWVAFFTAEEPHLPCLLVGGCYFISHLPDDLKCNWSLRIILFEKFQLLHNIFQGYADSSESALCLSSQISIKKNIQCEIIKVNKVYFQRKYNFSIIFFATYKHFNHINRKIVWNYCKWIYAQIFLVH